MRLSRRIVAALAVSLLVLAGCSNDSEGEDLDNGSQSTSDVNTEEPTTPEAVEPLISDEGMPTIIDTDGLLSLDFEGATEPDVLQVSIVEEGDGATVSAEDLVIVNYAGQVWGNEETFDSSYVRGTPTSFPLSGVVQGWRDGLAGQKAGSTVIVSVPSELGYGPSGGNESAGIGAEDTIVFVVEIIETIAPDAAGDPEATVVTPNEELPIEIEGELGEPTSITVKEGVEEPEEAELIMVAKSDGDAVGGAGSTVYFQYSAASWDNGQTESSINFGGVQNTTIGQGTVFDELEGVPIGSRVLILVPGDDVTPALVALVDVVGQMEAPALTE